MLKDIKARRMRYKSFTSLQTPAESECGLSSITETYQKIIQVIMIMMMLIIMMIMMMIMMIIQDELISNHSPRHTDSACGFSHSECKETDTNDKEKIKDAAALPPQVTVNMASDDEDDPDDDDSESECIILEIPRSRRSSFHGEALNINLTPMSGCTDSRRASQLLDLDIPVDT